MAHQGDGLNGYAHRCSLRPAEPHTDSVFVADAPGTTTTPAFDRAQQLLKVLVESYPWTASPWARAACRADLVWR